MYVLEIARKAGGWQILAGAPPVRLAGQSLVQDRHHTGIIAAADEAVVVAGIDDLEVSRWLSVVPHPYTSADFLHFLTHIAVPGETFVGKRHVTS